MIEHLKEPEKFLRNLYNQMSTFPNQKLIISTPNVANIVIRLMLLFGNFNYGRRGILDRTHNRLFTLRTFKNILLDQNFEINKIESIPIPFPLLIENKFVSNILIKMFNFLNLFARTLLAFQFLMVVNPKPSLEFLLKSAEIKKTKD